MQAWQCRCLGSVVHSVLTACSSAIDCDPRTTSTWDLAGDSVYGALVWESGIHRVQRVPTTETSGRVHTSAASVVVLAEADQVTYP